MADRDRIEALLHAYVDGELDAADAEELLAALRADRSRLSALEALERLAEEARALPTPPLPERFVEETMARIERARAPSDRAAPLLRRRIELSMAHLALAVALLLAAVGSAAAIGFQRGRAEAAQALVAQAQPAGTPVRFTLRADARTVELAGSFNGWTPAPLHRLPDGTFEAVLALPSGRHEYAFRVDGNWQPDPNAPAFVDDGFGGKNSVIEL